MFGVILLCVFIYLQAKRLVKFLGWLEGSDDKK